MLSIKIEETDVIDVPSEVVEIPKEERGNAIVKHRAFLAMGISLFPWPIIDLTAMTAANLKMLSDLSKLYGVEFSDHKVKNTIGALMGSFGVSGLAAGVFSSLLKFVPLIGFSLSYFSLSAVSGASTYAVGKVFIQHFEAGGTFLDFDPKKTREYFRMKFEEGRKLAAESRMTTH